MEKKYIHALYKFVYATNPSKKYFYYFHVTDSFVCGHSINMQLMMFNMVYVRPRRVGSLTQSLFHNSYTISAPLTNALNYNTCVATL